MSEVKTVLITKTQFLKRVGVKKKDIKKIKEGLNNEISFVSFTKTKNILKLKYPMFSGGEFKYFWCELS